MKYEFKIGDKVIIDSHVEGIIIKTHDYMIPNDSYMVRITKGGLVRNGHHGSINNRVIEGGRWVCLKSQLKPTLNLSDEADKTFRKILNDI